MLELFFLGESSGYNFKNEILVINQCFNYGDINKRLNEIESYADIIKKNRELRVWYNCQQPMFLSGFYWLCNFLVNIDYKGTLYRESNIRIIDDKCYGLSKEDVRNVINDRNLVSNNEIKENSKKWTRLCNENAYFRIIKNNELISDFSVSKNTLSESEQSVLMAMKSLGITSKKAIRGIIVVGEILGNYNDFNIGDQTICAIIHKLVSRTPALIELIPFEQSIDELDDIYGNHELRFTEAGVRLLKQGDL